MNRERVSRIAGGAGAVALVLGAVLAVLGVAFAGTFLLVYLLSLLIR